MDAIQEAAKIVQEWVESRGPAHPTQYLWAAGEFSNVHTPDHKVWEPTEWEYVKRAWRTQAKLDGWTDETLTLAKFTYGAGAYRPLQPCEDCHYPLVYGNDGAKCRNPECCKQ